MKIAVYKFLGKAILTVFFFISARVLGAEEYGKFAFVYSAFLTAFLIIEFGTHEWVLKDYSVNKNMGRILYLFKFYSIWAVFVITLVTIVVGRFINDSFILLFTVYAILYSLTRLFMSVLQSMDPVKFSKLQDFIEPSIRLIVLVLLIHQLKKTGVGISFIVSYIMLSILLFNVIQIKSKPTKFKLTDVFKFSISVFLINISSIIFEKLGNILLGVVKDLKSAGILDIAGKIASIAGIFSVSVNTSFGPKCYQLAGEKKIKELEFELKKSTLWLWKYTLPVFIFSFIFSKELLSIFGSSYTEGDVILKISIIPVSVMVLTGPVGFIPLATGKETVLLKVTVFSSLISLIMQIMLLKYGMLGVAIGSGSGVIISNLLNVYTAYRILKIHPFSIKCIKFLVLWASAGVIVYILK